jgi:SAM-dependent methyltransferase
MTQPSLHPFGLRADYRDNPRERYDLSSRYWTADRIRNASFFQASVYEHARQVAVRTGARTLIDVGCGVGVKLARIHAACPDLAIVGYDQGEGVDYCRATHGFGDWRMIDLECPDPAAAVPGDIVVCADVIEHLENPDPLLDFLNACLAPGGRLVLSTPDRIAARGRDNTRSPNPAHIREWSRPELKTYLERHGFTVLRQFSAMSVPVTAGRLFVQECLRPCLKGRSLFANQVCECIR